MSERESNLISHARRELAILEAQAAADTEDPAGCLEMQQHMTADVLAVLEVINRTGQSGGSIGYFLNLVRRLALQQNVAPLIGDDAEWFFHGEEMGNVYQNIRNGAVFKNADDGRAYYLDGYVTVDPNGSTYTGGGNRCYIEFPYSPVSKYLPRFELVANDPDFPKWNRAPLIAENYLFDTAQQVLEFYAVHGITQPEDIAEERPEPLASANPDDAPVREAE
jgi:hypothetical protein